MGNTASKYFLEKNRNNKHNNMIAIGIDNGISGAIAIVEKQQGNLEQVKQTILVPLTSVGKEKFIDEKAVKTTFDKQVELYGIDNIVVIFEMGQKQPMFGCKGNFSNGYSYGVIKTIVRLYEPALRHIEVNPRTWQKVIHKDIRGAETSTKEASIEYCKRTFPGVSLVASPRAKKAHDGIADALCMASYALKING